MAISQKVQRTSKLSSHTHKPSTITLAVHAHRGLIRSSGVQTAILRDCPMYNKVHIYVHVHIIICTYVCTLGSLQLGSTTNMDALKVCIMTGVMYMQIYMYVELMIVEEK